MTNKWQYYLQKFQIIYKLWKYKKAAQLFLCSEDQTHLNQSVYFYVYATALLKQYLKVN